MVFFIVAAALLIIVVMSVLAAAQHRGEATPTPLDTRTLASEFSATTDLLQTTIAELYEKNNRLTEKVTELECSRQELFRYVVLQEKALQDLRAGRAVEPTVN